MATEEPTLAFPRIVGDLRVPGECASDRRRDVAADGPAGHYPRLPHPRH